MFYLHVTFPPFYPSIPLCVLCVFGRAARTKVLAHLFVLTAFSVRHAVKIFFIYTAMRCLSGRPLREALFYDIIV